MKTKKLGFGLMRLPLIDKDDQGSIDMVKFTSMIDEYMKNGFTYFDTAYPYHNGNSEIAFREAVVKRYPRNAYTITDKLPMFMINEKSQIPKIFNEQLIKCGVEYFDYYWLHGIGDQTYLLSEEMGAFEFIKEKKSEGKIKHIGFSFHDSAEVLDKILRNHPEMEYVQLQINYIDWEDDIVQSRKCYEVAKKHNKPVIVMEPIKGGSLASISPEAEKLFKEENSQLSTASWAIRYAASFDNVMVVLSGMSNKEQLQDNISYMKEFQPLSEREEKIIEKAGAIIKSSIAIPCTSCHYCTENCPKNVAIPECFSIYNNLKRFGSLQLNFSLVCYENLKEKHRDASECIECKQCENVCPQHLPITTYLKEVANELKFNE